MLYVGHCPVCEQGLLGIRICCPDEIGWIVCDECEASWLEPGCSGPPLYPRQPGSSCPRCGADLWEPPAHWATEEEVERLGWSEWVVEEWEE